MTTFLPDSEVKTADELRSLFVLYRSRMPRPGQRLLGYNIQPLEQGRK